MLSRQTAQRALQAALSKGGDFAELFYEDTTRNTVAMLDGRINTAVTNRAHGAGIRVYDGLTGIYVHTNDTSESGLVAAALKAADAVGKAPQGIDVHLTRSLIENHHPVKILPMDVTGQKRREMLRAADGAAKAVGSEIAQVRATLLDWDSEITVCNTEGMMKTDRRVYSRFSVAAVATNGTENQMNGESRGGLVGYELFRDGIDAEELGRNAASSSLKMLYAEPCPAGVMPVVIDGGFGGVIFHEACGHSLEATSVAFGNSEFAGKLGQQIAAPCVTAIDDGTMVNEWGSLNMDDEGNPTTRLVLIENGILKNYMIDRLNSRRMNMPVTGSARRQDYRYSPTSRMRNTFIAPGSDDEKEIIATCGDGLYARSMGGGSVNPATGEFNFAVNEGYLIRDGKIDRPVRGATLIGRGCELLPKIDRVGKTMWMATGMCGSSSGSVPTNVGQPMIRVTGITVGGKKE